MIKKVEIYTNSKTLLKYFDYKLTFKNSSNLLLIKNFSLDDIKFYDLCYLNHFKFLIELSLNSLKSDSYDTTIKFSYLYNSSKNEVYDFSVRTNIIKTLYNLVKCKNREDIIFNIGSNSYIEKSKSVNFVFTGSYFVEVDNKNVKNLFNLLRQFFYEPFRYKNNFKITFYDIKKNQEFYLTFYGKGFYNYKFNIKDNNTNNIMNFVFNPDTLNYSTNISYFGIDEKSIYFYIKSFIDSVFSNPFDEFSNPLESLKTISLLI